MPKREVLPKIKAAEKDIENYYISLAPGRFNFSARREWAKKHTMKVIHFYKKDYMKRRIKDYE